MYRLFPICVTAWFVVPIYRSVGVCFMKCKIQFAFKYIYGTVDKVLLNGDFCNRKASVY